MLARHWARPPPPPPLCSSRSRRSRRRRGHVRWASCCCSPRPRSSYSRCTRPQCRSTVTSGRVPTNCASLGS
eukprot:5163166-Prymnesium_polylepis.1